MVPSKKAIIIGSGIGGLATAIRLAAKGYAVEIFEKNNFTGGKLAELSIDGFRFDAGPSLFTLPKLVDDLFLLHHRNPRDYFAYEKLNTICKYFYPDGLTLNAYQDVKEFANEIENKLKLPGKKLTAYLSKSRMMFDLTNPIFIEKSFHQLSTYFSKDFLKAIFNWRKLKSFSTVNKENSKWFKEPHLTQLFNRYATYNGSNPYVAPATLNVIPHLEHNIGAFFPDKGMYEITNALVQLTKELNIPIHLNSHVTEIIRSKNQVSGIIANGQKQNADIIVSNADIIPTYKLLKAKVPKSQIKFERSTSAIIFYWGIKGNFPQLDLHNILFSGDYKKEFNALFQTKTFYEDPTVYIFISSKKVKTDAPNGCENWFTMINVPENIGQDWDILKEQAKTFILKKIQNVLGIDIKEEIVAEKCFDPRDIELRTSAYHGSLYGNSSNSKFAAFGRHANYSRKYKGLFFVGGTVHPGGGIPLCLNSAKIVSELIAN